MCEYIWEERFDRKEKRSKKSSFIAQKPKNSKFPSPSSFTFESSRDIKAKNNTEKSKSHRYERKISIHDSKISRLSHGFFERGDHVDGTGRCELRNLWCAGRKGGGIATRNEEFIGQVGCVGLGDWGFWGRFFFWWWFGGKRKGKRGGGEMCAWKNYWRWGDCVSTLWRTGKLERQEWWVAVAGFFVLFWFDPIHSSSWIANWSELTRRE